MSHYEKWKKGMVVFDTLFAVLICLMIVALMIKTSSLISNDSRFEKQKTFNKIVSAAEYSVTEGLVFKRNGVKYPNVMDDRLLTVNYAEELAANAGLKRMYIGFEESNNWNIENTESSDYGNVICIYRLVLTGKEGTFGEKEIRKIFFCGG